MENKPSSSSSKFALTGTNCSGKTTMALDLTARLKRRGILAEIVSSQDRKITWKDAHFPVDARAHWGMITNLIHAEVQAELKGDADVVITDRSVLDLYAIATYDHPTSDLIKGLEPAILAWASTYKKIFYLEPLPYQADNKRPNDDFRMATHGQLLKLFDKYNLTNVVKLPRTEVFKEIKAHLNLTGNAVFAENEKWQAISNHLGLTFMVKKPESEVSSDYDVWVLEDPVSPNVQVQISTDLKVAFNNYWSDEFIDVMFAPLASARAAQFTNKVYSPQ